VRERFLSHGLFADLDAILAGCSDAWNRLVAEPGRIASLTDDPYLDRRPIPAVGQDFTRRA
jgi:hypothetical protein